jgi:hypothetical protein
MYICSEHGDKPVYRKGLGHWGIYKFLLIRRWQGSMMRVIVVSGNAIAR